MSTSTETIEQLANREYKYGFVTDIETETIPKGLNEDIVRLISAKKNEPEWLLEWRLKAYPPLADDEGADLAERQVRPDRLPGHHLLLGAEDEEDAQQPRRGRSRAQRDLREARHPARRAEAARRASPSTRCSTASRWRRRSTRSSRSWASSSARSPRRCASIRSWCRSISARSCPTPTTSSRRSTRRSSATARSSTSPRACAARWSCRPTSASTRKDTGQFERTLIVAEEGAYVSYLEGCTAPMRDENQLHAAVVELVALDDATIKYSTVQNWYPGDKDGKGGIYNFVTKRGMLRRARTRRSPGRRSRPARRSPGSTRAASCRATTRSASSTRWR